MGVVEKIIGGAMIILGVLILLEIFKVFSLALPFDKVLIGAGLMILFQVVNIIMMRIESGGVEPIHMFTAAIFSLPAAAYIVSVYVIPILPESLPMIVAVLMIAEGMYAMH